VYLVRVLARPPDAPVDAPPLTQVTGFVRPPSAEYTAFGTDEAALRRLAEVGGGRVLADPGEVFAHDRRAGRTYRDVWPWLLGAAICLLPLDVGVRRVAIEALGSPWAALRARFRRIAFAGRRPARARPDERFARLMAAKKRPRGLRPARDADPAPQQQGVGGAGADLPELADVSGSGPTERGERTGAAAGRTPSQAASPAPEALGRPAAERETMTARLLSAKQRARRRDAGEGHEGTEGENR
jgi:hypothetical protein